MGDSEPSFLEEDDDHHREGDDQPQEDDADPFSGRGQGRKVVQDDEEEEGEEDEDEEAEGQEDPFARGNYESEPETEEEAARKAAYAKQKRIKEFESLPDAHKKQIFKAMKEAGINTDGSDNHPALCEDLTIGTMIKASKMTKHLCDNPPERSFCRYPKIYFSQREAYLAAVPQLQMRICKVGTSYHVRKQTLNGQTWKLYNERRLQELMRREVLIYIATGKDKMIQQSAPLTKIFLGDSEFGREADYVVNKPTEFLSKADKEHGLNVWEPFAAENMPLPSRRATAKRLLHRMLEHLAAINDFRVDCFEFSLRWHSFVVRRPHLPGKMVLVYIGPKGCGKGEWVSIWRLMLGDKFFSTPKPEKYVWGNFNSAITGKVMIELSETNYKSTKEYMEAIKHFVTEPTIQIEAKGVDAIDVENTIHFLCCTNDDTPFPADRRFAQICCSDKLVFKHEDGCQCPECLDLTTYHSSFHELAEDQTAARVLFEFMKRVPDGDKPLVQRDIPKTDSRDLARQADEKYIHRFVKHVVETAANSPADLALSPAPFPHTKFELDIETSWKVFGEWKEQYEPRCFIDGKKLFEMEMGKAKELPGLSSERKSKQGVKKLRYCFDVAALNTHFADGPNRADGDDEDEGPQHERVGDLKEMASDFIDRLSDELGDQWKPDKDDDEDCSTEQSEKIDDLLLWAPLGVKRCEVAAVVASTSPEDLANAWMGTGPYPVEYRKYWMGVIHETVKELSDEQQREFAQRVKAMKAAAAAEEEEEEEDDDDDDDDDDDEEEDDDDADGEALDSPSTVSAMNPEEEESEDDDEAREAAVRKAQKQRERAKEQGKKRIQGKNMSDYSLAKHQKTAARCFGSTSSSATA